MSSEEHPKPNVALESGPHFVAEAETAGEADVQPWEQVDVGRYMPRRIRGSYKGRALG